VRYLLRGRAAVSPAATTGERAWFAFYGVASTLYRLFVTFVIAIFIGSQFFFIGVVLALWAVAMMVVVPVLRACPDRTAPGLRSSGRASSPQPAPRSALAPRGVHRCHRAVEGVIWLPSRRRCAPVPGLRQRAARGPQCDGGCGRTARAQRRPALDARFGSPGRVAELEATYGNEFVADRARAGSSASSCCERDSLERVRIRVAALIVSSPTGGVHRRAAERLAGPPSARARCSTTFR
jgi:putative peptide zinc metalloprotease protein